MKEQELDFTIERLGECRFPSPMQEGRFLDDQLGASILCWRKR